VQPYTEYLTGFLTAQVDTDDEFTRVARLAANVRLKLQHEVALKRLILDRHRPSPLRYVEADRCPRCAAPWPCPEVRALALVYSAHPDYRVAA
jgi:hypothetical protein